MEISKSKYRWVLIAAICLFAMAVAWNRMQWADYVLSWGGAMFRALSGAAVFWFLSRYVAKLDLSAIPEDRRAMAGVSQAILVAGGAIAVAVGT